MLGRGLGESAFLEQARRGEARRGEAGHAAGRRTRVGEDDDGYDDDDDGDDGDAGDVGRYDALRHTAAGFPDRAPVSARRDAPGLACTADVYPPSLGPPPPRSAETRGGATRLARNGRSNRTRGCTARGELGPKSGAARDGSAGPWPRARSGCLERKRERRVQGQRQLRSATGGDAAGGNVGRRLALEVARPSGSPARSG
ncbi:hypothetical protein KM043_003357 [Ampulex compressa]|nr:hypothetical protein KM043_003357 [Ampulex compressa]